MNPVNDAVYEFGELEGELCRFDRHKVMSTFGNVSIQNNGFSMIIQLCHPQYSGLVAADGMVGSNLPSGPTGKGRIIFHQIHPKKRTMVSFDTPAPDHNLEKPKSLWDSFVHRAVWVTSKEIYESL